MGIFGEIKRFVLETDAVWGLQVRLSTTHAVTEAFRPMFRAMSIEEKLDDIKIKGNREIHEKFNEELKKAKG